MLIINADDLGRSVVATDNILNCHARQRVTSTSAMVHMVDSERAANNALHAGIDIGLHLNFSEKFTGHAVPSTLQINHERIRRFLKSSKYSLLFFHPLLRRHFRYEFAAQHAEFLRLYGRPPSHIDGHQHMHMASNVLFQRLIPTGTKVRRSFSFQPGEKSLVNRWYRIGLDRKLSKRHRLTDGFYALSLNMSAERVATIAALAQRSNIELMTHPEIPRENEFLLSDDFQCALSAVRLSDYNAL